MNDPVRILFAEDRPTDAELAQREIRRVLAACEFRCVETREDFLVQIEAFTPDLIISDYSMPRFNGLEALHLALQHTPLTPVIILTGAINEDTAVECMKAGATDYVIKEHIKRLGQAVLHALDQQRLRRERQRAEEIRADLEGQLRQAQKLESIGRLASGVAHDFNNLLTVIQGYCDLIQGRVAAADPVFADAEQIRQAADRAAILTRQLLAFSRKQILAPSIIDLNDLIMDLRQLLGRLIGEDITVAMHLAPGLWPVTADVGQIEQVLMNLVVNARDAMPTGGFITIETANVYLDETYVQTHFDALAGPCVLLTVSDTGHGMDARTRERIFEPFFTTKEPGKGTGLGLAIVYGVVKQSGGDIRVYSESGRGTTFKIYLPISATAIEQIHIPEERQTPVRGGTETILLVEDDETVRSMARTALQAGGYTVLEACCGTAALEIAAQCSGDVDLLVTDVVMPEMSGRELAENLRRLHPQVNVLFMSGYTDETVVRHGLLTAEVAYLSKPFSLGRLVAKVREVMDANDDTIHK